MMNFSLWEKCLFLSVLIVFIGCGVWFFQTQHAFQHRSVETNLLSIARLKAKQISEWRSERIANAEMLMHRSDLVASVQRYFSTPSDHEANEILQRLLPVKQFYYFANILLVDPQQQVRLTLGPLGKGRFTEFMPALDMAIQRRQPIWTPVHVESAHSSPHLSVVAPLFSGEDTETFIGAIVLICDAEHFLFPIIKLWPTMSNTAETLLIQRSGENVLFLNELRHQKNPALTLQLPLSKKDLPAAMAIAGVKCIVASFMIHNSLLKRWEIG